MHAVTTDNPTTSAAAAPTHERGARIVIKRHSVATRVWHWVNFVCLLFLLMSGLQIFNAHPSLYWGDRSNFDSPLLHIGMMRGPHEQPIGVTRIAGQTFETTGVLGVSHHDGQLQQRAFPYWATLPGPQWLAMGRYWHFFFAWIFGPLLMVFLLYSLISGYRRRKLWPAANEWHDLPRTVWDHMRLRFPRGEDARHYNIIQKLTYLIVLFVIAPLVVLTGLTMSPTMDAAWPWLLTVFDGRQSARTIHFICAFSLVGFFVIHIVLVLVSGVLNNMRSMITGRYALPPAKDDA